MKHLNLLFGILSYIVAGIFFLSKQYYRTGYTEKHDWLNYFIFLFIGFGIFFFLKWIYLVLKSNSLKK